MTLTTKKLHTRFGSKLRLLRIWAGLSQAEIGRRMGGSHAHVCRMKSGMQKPSLMMVPYRILPALGLASDSLDAIELSQYAIEDVFKVEERG